MPTPRGVMAAGSAALMGAGMADGTNTGGRQQGQGKTELRISLGGTHTRRDDLEALHTWLKSAPVLEDALESGELTLKRQDSLTQTETMSGELIQDIILVVSVEVARSVSENAWRSVETWLRNRRRFADPEETPRVTLDGPPQGPGSDLSRDTDTDPGTGPGTGRAADPDAGPPEPGGRDRTRGGDEPGEV
ncbi:hypothetical protein [Streptomyces sp. NRRL S-4]|uniref:hypothetical protein n=1 Tax=Streptomyces sp. NRRL S-4 TaxID=1519471 RepID=UPI001F3C5F62|nr:hypothetical protein [Streptomyces sp. NRRL S-4]